VQFTGLSAFGVPRVFGWPRRVELHPDSEEVRLTVTLSGTEDISVPLWTPLPVRDLSLSRFDRFATADRPLVRSVSTIRSGTVFFERCPVKRTRSEWGKSCQFGQSRGEVREWRLSESGIGVRFRGTVSGLTTGSEGARRNAYADAARVLARAARTRAAVGTTGYVVGAFLTVLGCVEAATVKLLQRGSGGRPAGNRSWRPSARRSGNSRQRRGADKTRWHGRTCHCMRKHWLLACRAISATPPRRCWVPASSSAVIPGDYSSLRPGMSCVSAATARRPERSGCALHRRVLVVPATLASLDSAMQKGLDLAVLRIAGDPRSLNQWLPQSWDRQGVMRSVGRDDPVNSVGCPNDRCWQTPTPRTVSPSRADSKIEFQSAFVDEGSSGGALFNRSWEVIGMLVGEEPPHGRAIRVDRIVAQLDTWKIPLQLRTASYPRGGYRMSIGGSVMAGTGSGGTAGHVPSGRVTLMRQASPLVSWHVGVMRLAPMNLAITAGVAGMDIQLRAGRFALRPFGEASFGHMEARYDLGG